MGGGIGQANDEASRRNDFDRLTWRVNNLDGNERDLLGRLTIGGAIFGDPTINGDGRATYFASGLGNGKVLIKDKSNGSLARGRRIVATGHEQKLSYQPTRKQECGCWSNYSRGRYFASFHSSDLFFSFAIHQITSPSIHSPQ